MGFQNPYGHQGHHGLKHADDHGHFPEEELLKEIGNRAYKLKPYEKENIKHIEKRLKTGKLTHEEIHEYLHYLEHLSHHLKEILQEEKAEAISNLELEKELRKIVKLLGELSVLSEKHHH